ncbi:MAG: Beta-barrel assembly-enhancing protease [Verrucomicrobiae bacterium]|nr:Beta-barrel assembly-enhancing protease [Verrucomicrobiae bacterium]
MRERFYNRWDWLAAGIAASVVLAGYLWTLAPSVTLEDSGEFLTAAYGLGVPHPPGYPIWTMLAWVWVHVWPFGNIAWRGNLLSAIFSAAACGLAALLVARSGREFLLKVGGLWGESDRRVRELAVIASAICTGLLLAFAPVMWSQAVITEVYGLNACLLLAALGVLYRWSFEPEIRWRLYLAAFIWGVGLTAHQTLVLLTVAFPAFIWFTDRKFGRAVLVPVLVVCGLGFLLGIMDTWVLAQKLNVHRDAMIAAGKTDVPGAWTTFKFPLLVYLGLVVGVGYWLREILKDRDWRAAALTLLGVVAVGGLAGGVVSVWWLVLGVAGAIGLGVWIVAIRNRSPDDVRHAKQAWLVYGAVCLGLALYGYLYVAACTNPPINWGYCSEWAGFKQHFTRGQYENVRLDRTFLQFWGQLNMFFDDLQGQFNILYALLALFALFFYRDLSDSARNWLKFLFVGFLCLGLGFIFLSNPTFDKQKQFVDRVFFLPGHCLYALWIGYGLILGLGYLFSEKPVLQRIAVAVAGVVLILPVGSWWRNWSAQEERGHDFGYRFGYLMFKPGRDYPDMERNAILYGGTDPGRFVPTYLIFVESFVPTRTKSRIAKCPESTTFDRRDVYIITQNALADPTYLAYLRDHYSASRPRLDEPSSLTNRSGVYRALFGLAWSGLNRQALYPPEPIWIPSEADSQNAFARYVEELKTRAPLPGEEVRVEDGRVSVQGIAGVMAINSYLTKDIFERNKARHTFYVEESYVIQWMYPYLEPFGIIFKLNNEPLAALPPAMVARDTAYWDALTQDLTSDPKFRRDGMARKTFSKLRSAIGGLYVYRHMVAEAEHAFNQSIELCPDSPEANFRLAQLYVEQRRFDDALQVLEQYQKRDSYNAKIRDAIEQVKKLRADLAATGDLEKQWAAQPGDLAVAMQLARAYAAAQRLEAFDRLVSQLVNTPELSETDYLQLINYNAQLNRRERVAALLEDFTRRHPRHALGWYNYACVLSVQGNCLDGLAALTQALQLDGPDRQVYRAASQDKRLDGCRGLPQFQQLLGGGGAGVTPAPNLPFRLSQ